MSTCRHGRPLHQDCHACAETGDLREALGPTEGLSERLESMLRTARAATKGPWSTLRLDHNERPLSVVSPAGDAELGNWMVAERIWHPENAQHIATFNPRAAEALVKRQIAFEKACKQAIDFINAEYSSAEAAALQGDPISREARPVRDALVAALTAPLEDQTDGQ